MKRKTDWIKWAHNTPMPSDLELARAQNNARREEYAADEWYIGSDGKEYCRPKKDRINARRREEYASDEWYIGSDGKEYRRCKRDRIIEQRREYYANNREHITEQQRLRNFPNTQLGQYYEMRFALDIEREKRAKATDKYYARKEREAAKREAAYAAEKEARRIEEIWRIALNKRYELALQEPGIGHNSQNISGPDGYTEYLLGLKAAQVAA
jgi:hypothetical protein